MYYRESDSIVAKYPALESQIKLLDEFLYRKHDIEFSVEQIADYLRLNIVQISALVGEYNKLGLLKIRHAWLCPIHGNEQEVQFVTDNQLYCALCDAHYKDKDCEKVALYQVRATPRLRPKYRSEGTSEQLTQPVIPHEEVERRSKKRHETIVKWVMEQLSSIGNQVIAGAIIIFLGLWLGNRPVQSKSLPTVSVFGMVATPSSVGVPTPLGTDEVTPEDTPDQTSEFVSP